MADFKMFTVKSMLNLQMQIQHGLLNFSLRNTVFVPILIF